jgi:hypothetical protein
MKIRALHYLIYPSVNQLFMDDMPLLFELTPREEAPQPPCCRLLCHVCQPPPGWKPGDPIELLPDVVPSVKAESEKLLC